MNEQELKDWFFSDCPNMLKFWVEAEKTICGSNNLEQKMLDNNIVTPQEWLLYCKETSPNPHDLLRATFTTALDFTTDTPQEFDGGTPSLQNWKMNASRFVYLNNEWYSHCGAPGVLSTSEIVAIKRQRQGMLPHAEIVMTRGWRLTT